MWRTRSRLLVPGRSRRGDEHDVSRQSVFTPCSRSRYTHRGQIHHRISDRLLPKPSRPASAAVARGLQPYCGTIDFITPDYRAVQQFLTDLCGLAYGLVAERKKAPAGFVLSPDLNLEARRSRRLTRACAPCVWLENGTHMRQVADLLGHSSISITADVYGHGADDGERRAVEGLIGTLGL